MLSQDFLMLNATFCRGTQRQSFQTAICKATLHLFGSCDHNWRQIPPTQACWSSSNIPKPVTKKRAVFSRNVLLLLHIYLQLCCFGSITYSHVMQWHGRDWASSCWFKSVPTLSLHDLTRSFTQTERSSCMTLGLLQDHGGRQQPVAYFFS